MTAIRRHARVWRRCVLNALARETEYRANTVAIVAEGMAQVALAVMTFLVVYRFTPSIAGWTRPQALILVGVYRVAEGLINLQVAPNMASIGSVIRRGDMDYVLLRPVSSQFLVSVRTLTLSEGANVCIGLGITLYAAHAAGVQWSVSDELQAGIVLCCGVVLLYAVWFAIMTCSFWLVQVNNLDVLFFAVFGGRQVPGGILPRRDAGPADICGAGGICHHLPDGCTARQGGSATRAPGAGTGRPLVGGNAPLLERGGALVQQREQLTGATCG